MKKLGLILPLGVLLLIVGSLAAASTAHATFPGSDGRIAFVSERYGGTTNIYTMQADGSDVQQLTFLTSSEGGAAEPDWSPDGKTIVFGQNLDGSGFRLYLMSSDGSDRRLLFAEDPVLNDFAPTFTPDGGRVVFQRCHPVKEACAIYSVKVDGRGLTAIGHLVTDVFDVDPEVSPAGSVVAFSSFGRGGVQSAIYVMGLHGTNVHRVTPTELGAVDPDWSPNGTKIAFATHCCNPDPKEIWAIRPDGSGLERLTTPGADFDASPSYAPAGDKIAFGRSSSDFSTRSILTMDANGGIPAVIQTDAFSPVWGPAGS
jgi:Tol biopolymer transport system component